MQKKSRSSLSYPFMWLDETVEVTLNPAGKCAGELAADELNVLQKRFGSEVRQVLDCLKKHTFCIFSIKRKKVVLQQYHEALRLLKQQAYYNLENYPENSVLKASGHIIITHLDELSYDIERRYDEYLSMQARKISPGKTPLQKIICDLSIDQIGLILKAADDVKLVISRSLSLVYKSIVPHLSTRNKADLSWDSMRSNSYHPEDRDKQAAITALERLIRKIRDY